MKRKRCPLCTSALTKMTTLFSELVAGRPITIINKNDLNTLVSMANARDIDISVEYQGRPEWLVRPGKRGTYK